MKTMKTQKNKMKHKHILRNINISITVFVMILNILLFQFLGKNKSLLITTSIIANIYIFFLHCFILTKIMRYHLNDIKKEASYTNYASNIISFVLCIAAIILMSSGLLLFVEKEALNITLIALFFVSILTMLLPSIVLLAYLFFAVPALVVPSLTIKKYHQANSISILTIIFILFSILAILKYAIAYLYDNNFLTQIKYKVDKIAVEYSTRFLKESENLNEDEKRAIRNTKLNIPFLYTVQGFYYKDYNDAKMFCYSMDSRLPNHLEMYSIAFNKFNTFGENYYWTSTNEEREPLLIRFKNMSYTIEPYNENINPLVYCVSDMTEMEKTMPKLQRKYFIRKQTNQIKGSTINYNTMQDKESMEELMLLSKLNNSSVPTAPDTFNNSADQDKKFVGFSIKEVSPAIMKSLLQKGYTYNPNMTINPKYKVNKEEISSKIIPSSNKKLIRFCYYPFIDYSKITMDEEFQIWKQSFCSPSFELVQYYPQLTSIYEKDSFCSSTGGRLPNIPELAGILKTVRNEKTGIKYWTNTKVKHSASGVEMPISVYYKDSRFMVPNLADSGERAYTYCIKNSQSPSKLITNYKSRFKNTDGKNYANAICPDCKYHEVPDTILRRN